VRSSAMRIGRTYGAPDDALEQDGLALGVRVLHGGDLWWQERGQVGDAARAARPCVGAPARLSPTAYDNTCDPRVDRYCMVLSLTDFA
jgi:hypothetical protein